MTTRTDSEHPASIEDTRNFPLGVAGFFYADLYQRDRLDDLLQAFEEDLSKTDPALGETYRTLRAEGGAQWPRPKLSEALLALAPRAAVFLARLFGVENEHEAMKVRLTEDAPLLRFRRHFLKKVLPRWTREELAAIDASMAEAEVEALMASHSSKEVEALIPSLAATDIEALIDSHTTAKGLDPERQFVQTFLAFLDRVQPGDAPDRLGARSDTERPQMPAGTSPAKNGTPAGGDRAGGTTDIRASLELLERRAAWLHHFGEEGRHWVSLCDPENLDYTNLVRREQPDASLPEISVGPAASLRRRDGFRLTDPRMPARGTLAEAEYCILCHAREKDSCAHGLRDKAGQPKTNPLGIPLTGCPLEEKISEINTLRRCGEALAALTLIMIDNPMCPGTGHRICNDCMKSCIYQKQQPVNIPQVETGVLSAVLALPFGVEIYLLLTRFNPLNVQRPVPAPFHGKKVLVVGLGPAGYTLSHYLLNEGFGVVGIDGLKIEPLPEDLTGIRPIEPLPEDLTGIRPIEPSPGTQTDLWRVDRTFNGLTNGSRILPRAVRDYQELYKHLDERTLGGFGGVSEYGITVRWDKNFLALIHLALARRDTFRAYGGVRFGGTIDLEDCWNLGIDHVAIAAGAGKPTVVEMRAGLSRGIRQASDLLMTLQLTGAFKKESLANLQVRLPALVIGGGLTAIDTATELMAYYPLQVEKLLERFEILSREQSSEDLYERLDPEEREILDEFLTHGRAVRAERARARAAGEQPNLCGLVQSWGGATIVYRRTLQEAPAYRLNHEEVIKGLEEGVRFAERLNPLEAILDKHGAVSAIEFARMNLVGGRLAPTGETVRLPARTVCVAAGTSPNVIYEREHPGTFRLDKSGRYFAGHVAERGPDGRVQLRPVAPGETGFFTSYERGGRYVSYYGDNHPVYAGNVVRAMASARDGYKKIVELFGEEIAGASFRPPATQDAGATMPSCLVANAPAETRGVSVRPSTGGTRRPATTEETDRLHRFFALIDALNDGLTGRVVRVERLTPTIIDLVVRSPLAARRFQPGQFYRLQNFETDSPIVAGTRLALEGVALTGAWVDRERGLLSLIVLEMGASSRLCATFKPGSRIVVMGPTGSPTEIPKGENVLLAGGGLGNAVLFSIAKAMREAGNRVIYFAGYKDGADLFKREEIERATDQVIWSTDRGAEVVPARRVDRHFRGNIVQSILAYATGELGETVLPLREVNRILAIGSDKMMAAVKAARHGVLRPHLGPHTAIGSINSSMQCMLKEVCAQCLQQHCDPVTGEPAGVVFTCFCQDQILDEVDFGNLADRLRMNSVQEKITNRWLERLFKTCPIERV